MGMHAANICIRNSQCNFFDGGGGGGGGGGMNSDLVQLIQSYCMSTCCHNHSCAIPIAQEQVPLIMVQLHPMGLMYNLR